MTPRVSRESKLSALVSEGTWSVVCVCVCVCVHVCVCRCVQACVCEGDSVVSGISELIKLPSSLTLQNTPNEGELRLA